MSALILVTAALAAQAAAGAPPTTTQTEEATGPKAGQSTYLDIEAGAGYSTNPQLSLIQDSGQAFGRIDLHAVHSRISARSTTMLSAYAENVSYTGGYSSQQVLSFYGRQDSAVSEKLRLFGNVDASYDEGGQLDTRIVGLPEVPPLPGTPGTPPLLLPSGSDFLSVTGRQYLVDAHLGGQLAVSERDDFNFSSGVEHVVFHSRLTDTSYTSIPVSLGFDRKLSPRATVGLQVTAAKTEYNGPSSFRTITPQLTAQMLLSSRLTFSGAVGVSFASIDDGVDTRHSTGLAANATLCNSGEHSRFCGHASVDQQTATTAGPAKSYRAGLDYTHDLGPASTIQLSVSAEHYSQPLAVVTGQNFSNSSYYRAAAAYTRAIGHRWFGGVNLAGRKVTISGPDPKGDVSGSLFVRYRLGDIR